MTTLFVIAGGLFVLAAACYLLFTTSDPLEKTGGRLGRLFKIPEDVIASTLQAAATSGPEIVMAILASTTFIAGSAWESLEMGERACSGCLNMCFSAMDNLLGIGCLGIILILQLVKSMKLRKFLRVKEDFKGIKASDKILVSPAVKVGLIFYIIASGFMCLSLKDGALSVKESWVLMWTGITFIIFQCFLPFVRKLLEQKGIKYELEDDDEEDEEPDKPLPTTPHGWLWDVTKSGFVYAALVYALILFVRACMSATFNMATLGIVSIGGLLMALTSYVSSFPEFMMTYRYAVADKKNALLAMLFGSNVIDLAFAGFRAIRLGEPMAVYSTGSHSGLLIYYLWALPIIAILALIGLYTKKLRYWIAYPAFAFYVAYILSGLFLL